MINDGGPAFPVHPGVSFTDGEAPNYGGMSLRDYFAAAALQGLLASTITFATFEGYAKCAYHHADAMLAERAKGQP